MKRRWPGVCFGIFLILIGLASTVIGLYFTWQASLFWGIVFVCSVLVGSTLSFQVLQPQQKENDQACFALDAISRFNARTHTFCEQMRSERVVREAARQMDDYQGWADALNREENAYSEAMDSVVLLLNELVMIVDEPQRYAEIEKAVKAAAKKAIREMGKGKKNPPAE